MRWRSLLSADVISEDALQNEAAADHSSAADDLPSCLVTINPFYQIQKQVTIALFNIKIYLNLTLVLQVYLCNVKI